MTRISCIVPTFNRSNFLGEALQAIVDQANADDEILVIDDGSTDTTRDVVAAFGPRVRYIHQANAGKAVALNRALAQTDGEFVLICDDDDILRPGALEALLAGFAQSPDAGFVFGRYARFHLVNGQSEYMAPPYWPDLSIGAVTRHILEDAFVFQNATLVRRSAYQAIGPFSEGLPRSLDYDMFVRLATAFSPCFVDLIVFDQRNHGGDRGPANALHSASAMVHTWAKWDSVIFRGFYPDFDLGLFKSFYDCDDPRLLRRVALLQRAVIMARHSCWDHALVDMRSALAISEYPLAVFEQEICMRALDAKLGLLIAAAPDAIASLADLRRASPLGKQLVDAALTGISWRLRRSDSAQWRQAFAVIRTIGGFVTAVRLIMPMHRAQPGEVPLRERSQLAPADYLSPGTLRATMLPGNIGRVR